MYFTNTHRAFEYKVYFLNFYIVSIDILTYYVTNYLRFMQIKKYYNTADACPNT